MAAAARDEFGTTIRRVLEVMAGEVGHIFGPVPSRRLGLSLGVDVIPMKVCTLNCTYCELGRTNRLTVQRQEYVSSEETLQQLDRVLKQGEHVDYITFSGSGEPTLNSRIGEMIRRVKEMTRVPVAVLTNGTLLYDEAVRSDLQAADVVLPSLDAVSPNVFHRINRPHGRLKIERIIDGLIEFRQEYRKQIWLEIMFVKDVNDDPREIERLKKTVDRIQPDKVQLNTVVRPPAESDAEPLDSDILAGIQKQFGETCEVIAAFRPQERRAYRGDIEEAILALTARRPVTVEEIAQSLGRHRNEISKFVSLLSSEGRVSERWHEGRCFYINADGAASERLR
jgi:wyosine [tRNA(Phe)-imidazoG37] synthetase (radical SAM superfamily)